MSLAKVEIWGKIFAIIGIIFAILKFFIDQHRETESLKMSNTLNYIEKYQGNEIQDSVHNLNEMNFKISIALSKVVQQNNVSKLLFERALYSHITLESNKAERKSIAVLYRFFVEVQFCAEEEICSLEATMNKFCKIYGHLNTPFRALEEYYDNRNLRLSPSVSKTFWSNC